MNDSRIEKVKEMKNMKEMETRELKRIGLITCVIASVLVIGGLAAYHHYFGDKDEKDSSTE